MAGAEITLSQVRFRWGRREPLALDLPLFEVAAGERVFVKGPSGSGKTTLLNLLGGVAVPEAGRVAVMGTDLTALSGARRDAFRADHIGFIFQMFNLVPYLSLLENVVLPCRFSAQRRARALARAPSLAEAARELLTLMELEVEGLAGRAVSRLSVGQQQRVAAARALIGVPDLVIADEPTSSLDADARQSFLQVLFREIKAAGSTLVFVSHDDSLRDAFDRTVVLVEVNRARPEA